jgi:threonine synthase
MNFFGHLQCSSCEKKLDAARLWNLCPACHKPLLARYDLQKARKLMDRSMLKGRAPNIWRYRELLPVQEERFMLTLGEGYTPLIEAKRLSQELNVRYLFIKDEGLNPTGSFKARGLAVAVSRAWELGAHSFSIPSAGNAAGALSAYAALARLPAHVFMPKDVPTAFISECKALGAQVQLVDGLITDCGRVAMEGVQKNGWFDVSTLKEPYRLEGKKTMGYEIAEQFDWELPDVLIYPTGGGTGLVGMWKAFQEMESLGWIGSKRPRMVSVQAEGCAPMVKAFHDGLNSAETWPDAHTIADGLRVPAAIGDFLILKVLRESNGTAISVSDREMLEGANLIGKTQGLFVSPETGATVAAFKKLIEDVWIRKGERVVLFNTGSGYKYAHLWKKDLHIPN